MSIQSLSDTFGKAKQLKEKNIKVISKLESLLIDIFSDQGELKRKVESENPKKWQSMRTTIVSYSNVLNGFTISLQMEKLADLLISMEHDEVSYILTSDYYVNHKKSNLILEKSFKKKIF